MAQDFKKPIYTTDIINYYPSIQNLFYVDIFNDWLVIPTKPTDNTDKVNSDGQTETIQTKLDYYTDNTTPLNSSLLLPVINLNKDDGGYNEYIYRLLLEKFKLNNLYIQTDVITHGNNNNINTKRDNLGLYGKQIIIPNQYTQINTPYGGMELNRRKKLRFLISDISFSEDTVSFNYDERVFRPYIDKQLQEHELTIIWRETSDLKVRNYHRDWMDSIYNKKTNAFYSFSADTTDESIDYDLAKILLMNSYIYRRIYLHLPGVIVLFKRVIVSNPRVNYQFSYNTSLEERNIQITYNYGSYEIINI